jgi:hypothetical protein
MENEKKQKENPEDNPGYSESSYWCGRMFTRSFWNENSKNSHWPNRFCFFPFGFWWRTPDNSQTKK